MARQKKTPTPKRVQRVQGLKYGHAAGFHGKGRNRRAERQAAIRDQH